MYNANSRATTKKSKEEIQQKAKKRVEDKSRNKEQGKQIENSDAHGRY